jgi:hypothetical protein
LQVAQAGLTNAEAAAARARRDYMRAYAREQALATLMANQTKQWQAKDFHAEEAAAEDLQTNRSRTESS